MLISRKKTITNIFTKVAHKIPISLENSIVKSILLKIKGNP